MWSDLRSAVGWGSASDVQSLLEAGFDPNEVTRGQLPLNVAVRRQEPEKIGMLLHYGANPNRRDAYSQDAILLAVASHDSDTLRTLISAGGSVDGRYDPGNLIAVAVLWKGAETMIPPLVDMGVDPDDYNDDGYTPLMLAAANGALEAISVLLDIGAKIEQRDLREGWTAFLHAVACGMAAEERLLVGRGADTSVVDNHGRGAEQIRRTYAAGRGRS